MTTSMLLLGVVAVLAVLVDVMAPPRGSARFRLHRLCCVCPSEAIKAVHDEVSFSVKNERKK